MKIALFSILLLLFTASISFGQERVLKSEVTFDNQSKTDPGKILSPKISINDSKCRLTELTIRKSGISQAEITFSFERPCDGKKEVSVIFNDLQEALTVRELLMTNQDYTMFNIVSEKDQKTFYELRF